MKAMRTLLKVFVLLGFSLSLSGQVDTSLNMDQFVFPDFSVGIVKLHNGEKVVLKLNYNIVTEKMVFMQEGKIFDIVNQSSIDTVYMHERKFVPIGKAFYEILVNKPVSLFLQNKGTVKAPSRPAAYGGSSDVSSSTYINNMRLGNDVFRMNHKAQVNIVENSLFWIRKNGQMYLISQRKQLFKLFPDKRSMIREILQQNQVDIENTPQLVMLVNSVNGQTN